MRDEKKYKEYQHAYYAAHAEKKRAYSYARYIERLIKWVEEKEELAQYV